LNKNIDKFLVHINTLKHKFNIIILTEIWNTNIQIITNKFENYNIHINTPKEKKAGGVAILIKKDIPYNLIHELQTCNNSIETIAIKTNINNKTHVIIGIYKHPNTNSNLINAYINHTMQNITKNYNTIIMGDININLMDTENKDTILYTNNMNYNKLFPLIDARTRITNNTATIIDHIYIKEKNKKSQKTAGIITTDISDHYSQFLIFQTIHPDFKSRPLIRNFNKQNTDNFKNIMNSHISKNELLTPCPNKSCENIIKKMQEAYEKSFPLIKISINQLKKNVDSQWNNKSK